MSVKSFPKTAILILNWKNIGSTLRCIASIMETQGANFEIYVLDNETTEIRFKKLERNLESFACTFHLFESKQNLGFTGGINYLINRIDHDRFEYFFLLNNDAHINAQTLPNLIEQSKKLNCHIIGPANNAPPRSSSRRWPQWLFGIKTPTNFDKNTQSWPTCNVDGSGLLLTKKLVTLIINKRNSLLDVHYFLYGEDTELGLLAEELGYKSRITSLSTMYHKRSNYPTEDRRALTYYYTTRNRIFLALKYLHPLLLPLFMTYFTISRIIISGIKLIQNKTEFSRAIISGMLDGLSNKTGKWKKHK